MEEDTQTYDCDYEDCPAEDADRIMVVEGQPVGVVCQEHMELIQSETRLGERKVNLDVHFHRHTVISLVDNDFDVAQMGANYMDGAPAS